LQVGHDRIPGRRPGVPPLGSFDGVDVAANSVSERIPPVRRGRKCRAIDQASKRFAVSAHGSLAAISDGIEIVRRMATISHFHAPSSPGDADERTMAQFSIRPLCRHFGSGYV
jgi:hypothetical protein